MSQMDTDVLPLIPKLSEPVPVWWTWLGRAVQPEMSMSEPKTKRTRRRFDEEFRRNAVALISEAPVAERECICSLGLES